MLQRTVERLETWLPSLRIGADDVSVQPPPSRAEVDAREEMLDRTYPRAQAAGGILGSAAGTAGAVSLAPGLFGAGAGPLLARMGQGALSGAALTGADTAVRGGDPLEGAVIVEGILKRASLAKDQGEALRREFGRLLLRNNRRILNGFTEAEQDLVRDLA